MKNSRLAQHHQKTASKLVGIILVVIVLVSGLVIFWKYPFFSSRQKQYLVAGNKITKVTPKDAPEVKKTLSDVVIPKPAGPQNAEVTYGNEFARWAVLDYYPGGYHVIYPDGFNITYTPAQFTAAAPGGGSVIVSVSGQSFNVSAATSGLSQTQAAVIEAAARLIKNSFEFISGPGYDPNVNKARFGH